MQLLVHTVSPGLQLWQTILRTQSEQLLPAGVHAAAEDCVFLADEAARDEIAAAEDDLPEEAADDDLLEDAADEADDRRDDDCAEERREEAGEFVLPVLP